MFTAWCLDTARNLYLNFILISLRTFSLTANCEGGYCPLLRAERRKIKDLQFGVGQYSPHSRSFKTSPETKGNDIEQAALDLASIE